MSKNKSHRVYIKEKTNQIVNLYPISSKPQLKFQKVSPNIPKSDTKLHETSFALNSSRDTSLSKRLKLKDSTNHTKEGNLKKASKYYLKVEKCIFNKPISKIRSQEVISFKNCHSPSVRKSFSVRKHLNVINSASKHSVESVDSKKKQKIEIKEIWKQGKNENYLKQTQILKKTSGKLKLKVKDPFEKKMRLDNEFQDESIIGHHQQSFISTINEEQFRQILNKIA